MQLTNNQYIIINFKNLTHYQYTFTSNDTSTLNAVNPNSTFNINPLEKWLESLTEIRRLNAEIIRVKDEQIAAQKEQIALLKEIMKK